MSDIKVLTESIAESAPLAFHAAHPRNIVPPSGYFNPKHYASTLVGDLLVVRDPAMNQLPHLTAYMTALTLIANKVPTYFVAYEFAQAVANTELPRDFKFAEIKWPLDAQLFVLPDQFVMQYYGCYAPFMALCRCPAGDYPGLLRSRLPQTEIPYTPFINAVDKLAVDFPIFHNRGTPTDYNGNYPMSAGVEVFATADWVDSTRYEEELHGFTVEERRTDLAPDQEKIFMDKALSLAMKLILAVACRPGAVEHGHVTRPVKVKRDRVVQKELWSPNVIGRSYRIPRQGITTVTTGPRSKARFTFRRGHYAWVAKRFKGVEFVSVEQMPHREDGTIDFDAAGTELSGKFRTVHERQWIEGILFGDEGDSPSKPCANPS
jgi:hypothetical protein